MHPGLNHHSSGLSTSMSPIEFHRVIGGSAPEEFTLQLTVSGSGLSSNVCEKRTSQGIPFSRRFASNKPSK